MFVLVVGGGKVGYYLTKELIDSGHEVALMEKDRGRAEQIRDEIGSVVIGQDGCEGKYLHEAGANRADIVAAVTGDDEDNLVICQMAKHHFAVPRTIARVNNPKNEHLFRHLGVDEIISPTRMILGSIEQDIPVHELLHLAALGVGELEIIEAHLQPGSPAIGRVALDLDRAERLLSVRRDPLGRPDAAPDGHDPGRGRQGDRDRAAGVRGSAARAADRGVHGSLTFTRRATWRVTVGLRPAGVASGATKHRPGRRQGSHQPIAARLCGVGGHGSREWGARTSIEPEFMACDTTPERRTGPGRHEARRQPTRSIRTSGGYDPVMDTYLDNVIDRVLPS